MIDSEEHMKAPSWWSKVVKVFISLSVSLSVPLPVSLLLVLSLPQLVLGMVQRCSCQEAAKLNMHKLSDEEHLQASTAKKRVEKREGEREASSVRRFICCRFFCSDLTHTHTHTRASDGLR